MDLFGLIPLRRIRLQVGRETRLMPGGSAVGVALATRGVLVVGVSDVAGQSPAQQAGLRAGDVIEAVDGSELSDSSHLTRLVAASGGKPLAVSFRRNGLLRSVRLSPLLDRSSGQWRIGAWVRDSTAGVGTLSDDSTRLYFQAVFRSSRENAGGRCPRPRRGGGSSPGPAACGWCKTYFSSNAPQGQGERKHAAPGQAGFAGRPVRKRTGENSGDFRKNERARFSEIPAVFLLPGSSLADIKAPGAYCLLFQVCNIVRKRSRTRRVLVRGSGG